VPGSYQVHQPGDPTSRLLTTYAAAWRSGYDRQRCGQAVAPLLIRGSPRQLPGRAASVGFEADDALVAQMGIS
jgi:hypothetical protein